LVQALLALIVAGATRGAAQDEPLEGEVARLVAELAAPTRAARLAAQERLLALPEEAVPLLDHVEPPPGFEPGAALAYVRGHRPRAPKPIAVPAGTYKVGSTFGPDQNPTRTVTISGFFVDDVEVTCFEWWRFVRATGTAAPPDWIGGRYRFGGESQPVGNVTAEEAGRFAAWVGGRLPTTDEWEVAAHGGSPRPYPWGGEFEGHLARRPGRILNWSLEPPDVGSEPEDRSPSGASDFTSSLMEWVLLPDGRAAARGGSFLSGGQEFLRLTRAADPRISRRPVVGVRVVDRQR
jgi:formylglycine-generating enzyme required for sulfatase activity